MRVLYYIFISLYPKIAWLISGGNRKAALWLEGRKNIFDRLQEAFTNNTAPVIWMHCSSLGEFEQGRPVLEQIKQQYSKHKILLTFFSPSGYEIRKDYKGADWIFYLPMDSPSNARRFIQITNPALVLFVKYEFWHYYLSALKKREIPLLLISAIFRKDQPFFKWYGRFHQQMLQCVSHFFVQTDNAAALLASIGYTRNVTIAGDTRFDRVIEIAEQFEPIRLIETFIGSASQVIVAGSTWTEDDEELDHFANTHPEIKFIIAPHDISEERIKECQTLYKHNLLFSHLKQSPEKPHTANANVLIIDNIGMLSRLYKYATITYVGGAFGEDGVHNVLEAAVYYKPVIFGPEYDKYIEAAEVIGSGGGFSIENALELEELITELIADEKKYRIAADAAGRYVESKAGATQKICSYIQEKRLLTN
ncbi:MAG: 3-deoxy-D-manno-octulosonic acid transferase [Bacteroidota bacterium]|nr:3-deoxy-D-manno-octulosonic acid transferase [Bacteroidota bacterium]